MMMMMMEMVVISDGDEDDDGDSDDDGGNDGDDDGDGDDENIFSVFFTRSLFTNGSIAQSFYNSSPPPPRDHMVVLYIFKKHLVLRYGASLNIVHFSSVKSFVASVLVFQVYLLPSAESSNILFPFAKLIATHIKK